MQVGSLSFPELKLFGKSIFLSIIRVLYDNYEYFQIKSNVEGGIDMCRYEKHGEMIGRLRSLERQYGRQGLVKIGSIGKSVSGRDLIYIKISRNATGPRQMTEPMFKYE